MPHPDDDSELPEKPRRRPSHFRKKRRDATTKLVRVSPVRSLEEDDGNRVVLNPRAGHEQWNEVVNPAPMLPDPVLHRPIPPPAPLPSETSMQDSTTPGWLDDSQRRKRVEDILGTLVLAVLVAAMLVAMWLRMTHA